MHDNMGSVQQIGEKSIKIFTLAYQLLQAFNLWTRSFIINHLCAILWSLVY